MMSRKGKMLWAGIVIGTMALFMMPAGGMLHGQTRAPNRLGKLIAELERTPAPDGNDLYRLGDYHQQFGRMYTMLGVTCIGLSHRQAECYMKDNVVSWGAEYFGALAALERDSVDLALAFCESGIRAKSSPRLLVGLLRILHTAADLRKAGTGAPQWSSFQPKTRWDSLEVSYQVMKAGGRIPVSASFFAAKRSSESGIDLSPLVLRVQLIRQLAENRVSELREWLQELEFETSAGLPMWSITAPRIAAPHDSVNARFCEPAIPFLVAKAHYILAQIGFARAEGLPIDRESAPRLQDAWMDVCAQLGDEVHADSFLSRTPGSPTLLPYRGWVAWQRGNTQAAWESWNDCLDPTEYKTTTALLQIWSGIPKLRARGWTLLESMLTNLGNNKQRNELRDTFEGRTRLFRVCRSIARWYLANQKYDSSAFFFKLARPNSEPIGLGRDTNSRPPYTPDFCAEYFAAKTLSHNMDFWQVAYEGWGSFLEHHYLSVRGAYEALEETFYCETGDHME